MRAKRLFYKGVAYHAIDKATTVNGGEYYICFAVVWDGGGIRLIPVDSDEVILV